MRLLFAFVFATIAIPHLAFSKQMDRQPASESQTVYNSEIGKCLKLTDGIGECANLNHADLNTKRLQAQNLKGANLKNAQLVLADLGSAKLQGVDLRFARLEGAFLVGIQMDTFTQIYGAQFDKFTVLPNEWGETVEARRKEALRKGLVFVEPPYDFYHPVGPQLRDSWVVHQRRRLLYKRSQATGAKIDLEVEKKVAKVDSAKDQKKVPRKEKSLLTSFFDFFDSDTD